MALPEGTKLRKGDVVALHATVKYDFDPENSEIVHLNVPGASYCQTSLSDIDEVVRRRFDIGEQVKARIPSPHAGELLTIECISEDCKFLWLRHRPGVYVTLYAGDVEPVEPEPEPEEADVEAAQ